MNPYFLEYLQNPAYGYAPLHDPIFLVSAALAGVAVFGVPGLLIGILSGDRTVLAASVVGATAVALSLLIHVGRITTRMAPAYATDLAFSVACLGVLTWVGRRWSRYRAGGPTTR
jgi:hypothetical protein